MKKAPGKGKVPNMIKVAVISTAAVLVMVALICRGQNRKLYSYDVSRDYRYLFAGSGVSHRAVAITGNTFLLPKETGGCDSAFLEVRVKSTAAGHLIAPCLDLRAGDVSYRQYFEVGGQGVRYLNVSPFCSRGGGKITLSPHRLDVERQEGDLVMFRNAPLAGRKIMVLAPHPDDAELAAFGLYSHRDAYVVTVTDGGAGEDTYRSLFPAGDRASSYLLKSKLRVIDSLTVPSIGGIGPERCVNLGYFDGTLSQMHQTPSLPCRARYSTLSATSVSRRYNSCRIPDRGGQATWSALVEDLKYLLREIRPDLIVAPHPLLDAHPDHQYASIALFSAVREVGLKGDFFLYTNHDTLTSRYPFGRQGSLISLPPYFPDGHRFGSVYSLALNRSAQIEKLFALDAMHALRLPPQQGVLDASAFGGLLDPLARIILTVNRAYDAGYYRRAVRSNELFFVYPFDEGGRLIGAYEQRGGRGLSQQPIRRTPIPPASP